MSPDISNEVTYLMESFFIGILITFIYDFLRIFRRVFPHGVISVSVEDFAYWMGTSVLIFRMLYQENNGVLRWFAVAGATIGMFLYKITLGFLFVKYASWLINRLLHIVTQLFRIVLRPLNLVGIQLNNRCLKSWKRLKTVASVEKKKLTRSKKVLKMILCKH